MDYYNNDDKNRVYFHHLTNQNLQKMYLRDSF
jgi:hypothetical protein